MHKPEDITEEFLVENDGKIVWLRDDHLSMRGYSVNAPDTLKLLNKVVELKTEMRKHGYIFKY